MLYNEGVQRPIVPEPTLYPTFWINHASRAIMRHFEERLRPLGLGVAYMPVLFALADGPKSQKELLTSVTVSQPTLAALLARMERDSVLTREPNPRDRREQLITLTAQSQANLPQAIQALLEVVDVALAGIAEDDRKRMMELLKLVVANLDSA